MNNRLVAFGCSYTFGHWLPDAMDCEGPCSLHSWPFKLAEMLNIKNVENKGVSGASNKEILYQIQNFDFYNTDIVVVLWSYLERDCIITENRIVQGYPNSNKNNTWYFDKLEYGTYDGYYQMWTYINYAKMFFDKIGIENYHFSIDEEYTQNPPAFNEVNVHTSGIYHITEDFPLAPDGLHPGLEGHEQIAKNIKEKIDAYNK